MNFVGGENDYPRHGPDVPRCCFVDESWCRWNQIVAEIGTSANENRSPAFLYQTQIVVNHKENSHE